MLTPSREQLEDQVKSLIDLSSTPSIIYFDDFVKSLAPLYKKGQVPDVIRIAKDEDSLLAGDTEPAFEINLKEHIDLLEYNGMPMWHNMSNDQLSLHGLGLIEGNRSAPSSYTLYDTNPHGNIGGATGHGKSVLANSIIIASSLVHPPWLVQYYLSDPKITEMKPYATSPFKLPHVDAVAATEDPEYAISVLEYLLAKMDKRASIYDRFRVKNIDGFNKNSGLVMPMMVLVLDELKAMLQTAGRRAGHVDKLIQAFVAKARFAGGRCIMLSQGVVTELDPATMKNVNIRVALGCTPAESEKLVGNPGASINLGTMGKITYNDTPEKTLKQNVYMTTPFLPDKANDHSKTIYDIFEHQHKVWEKLVGPGKRISPLSFFDQTAPLKKEDFHKEIVGKVDTGHIFIGEPVYISKSEYSMASINFDPFDKFSDNLANNVLFLSQHGKHRLNFLSTLLLNFDELRKTNDIDVRIYSPLSQTNDTIEALGHTVDAYTESGDIAQSFARVVSGTLVKILLIKADEVVFKTNSQDSQMFENPAPLHKQVVDEVAKFFGRLKGNNRKRVLALIPQFEEERSRVVLGISGPLSQKNVSEYIDLCINAMYYYEDMGCLDKQMTAANTPRDIRVFFNFHLLNGTEVKTNRNMDMWMNIVRLAPVYGIHFIVVSDMLPNCGSSLNGNFNKIVFYYPTNNAIAQQKLNDDYPPSTLECIYIFADKTKTTNRCVKIKFAEMLEDE